MGLISGGKMILGGLFGSGRNVVAETVEVFRPNAEASADRSEARLAAALAQLSAEQRGTGWFNAFVDGLNRLPRPVFALGVPALFAFAMYDPDAFTARMVGLAYVPEPLWWILGAVVSFYFGARELHYSRQGVAADVRGALVDARAAEPSPASAAAPDPIAAPVTGVVDTNAALAEWKTQGG